MVQAKLLDIAVREFGLKGPEGVSTRDLASAAGTAMSSITYHYGGKEGLYLAAAEHIAAEMERGMAPVLDADPPTDPVTARADIHRILGVFAAKLMEQSHDSSWSLFIMREQMRPTEAFDRLYAGPMGRISERLVADVHLATGAPLPDAQLVAVMLVGQVVVWRGSRALAERIVGCPTDDTLVARITARLRTNTDCILDRLADPQEPQ